MSIRSVKDLLLMLRSGRAGLCADSRKVRPGDIFVALPPATPGDPDRSMEYTRVALGKGASVIVSSLAVDANIDSVRVDDTRKVLGQLAAALYGTDCLPFPLIAVTGTNGKTTSVYLLEHVFRAHGRRVGVLGTVSYRWPGYEREAPLTTPDCLTLHQAMAAMRDSGPMEASSGGREHGVDAAVMELSSHALDQQRVSGLNFSAALFTNLTQDHLDYHRDMEAYFAAKKRLFTEIPHRNKIAVINADDAYGHRLLDEIPGALGFSLHIPAGEKGIHLSCRVLSDSPQGLELELSTPVEQWRMRSPLVGRHNAANLTGVMLLALKLGFNSTDFSCFHEFYGVSGRLERVLLPDSAWSRTRPRAGVFVDYAHTPDALERAQEALREAGFARLITVFGCGGDRDRGKRPLMGRAVAKLSDIAVVTSDNPRTEDPEAILDDIMPGLKDAPQVHRHSDRREALSLALDLMRDGDALLVAGKGHEPYQIIGTTRHSFSDQAILKELMTCK